MVSSNSIKKLNEGVKNVFSILQNTIKQGHYLQHKVNFTSLLLAPNKDAAVVCLQEMLKDV